MISTLAPSARQNAASFSTAAGVGVRRRRQDAPAVDEQFGEAGVGAGILGAGDRMGRERNARASAGAAPCRAAPRPSPSRRRTRSRRASGCGPISAATGAAGADRNAEDDEVGAFAPPRRWSRPPGRRGRARARACASPPSARWRRSSRTAPLRARGARDRRADQADADQREAVERWRRRVTPAFRHELGERRDHQPVRLLGADGHAQRVRQPIGARPRAGSGRARSGTRRPRRRSCPCVVGKMDQHEIADARRHLRGRACRSRSVSQASHFVVVRDARLDDAPRPRSRRRRPRSRGALTLNGPRMRLSASTTCAGPYIQPRRSAGEPVDLREGARHHDVLAGRDQLDAGLVVVARAHIRHRPRRAPAAHAAAGRRAGASPRRTAGRCRSDCSGWRGTRSSCARVTAARIASTSAVKFFSGATTGVAPGAERRDRIDQEAVRGVDRLVAAAEIGVRQQVQQLVGAGAADDARRDRARRRGRSPRAARSPSRPDSPRRCSPTRLIGLDRLRARPERRLVGGQLEDLRDARRAALAGHIGVDLEHAGARLRALGRGHRVISGGSSACRSGRALSPSRRHGIAGRVAADEGRWSAPTRRP